MKHIVIIDLSGQYCHLISRRLRDMGVWAEILPPSTEAQQLSSFAGIILSGGPRSVYDPGAPTVDRGIFELNLPILGICYGHQLLAQTLGGKVERRSGEYGLAHLDLVEQDSIFVGTRSRQDVWMSHSDAVVQLPKGATVLARTAHCDNAAFADLQRRFFGVQFHPEVVQTTHGDLILQNFVRRVCRVEDIKAKTDRVDQIVASIRKEVGDRSVFFFVSGGVDSTVAFALCARVLPHDRVLGVYVDTGLMREGETAELLANLGELGVAGRIRVRDERGRFLEALRAKTKPEEKREIIGRKFVEVQAAAMQEYGIDSEKWMLGQGTIYPDTIESGGASSSAAVIKTHHNRCEEIRLLMEVGKVIEPWPSSTRMKSGRSVPSSVCRRRSPIVGHFQDLVSQFVALVLKERKSRQCPLLWTILPMRV